MYKISVPIMLSDNVDKHGVLEALRKAEAEYVFIAIDMTSYDPRERQKKLTPLKPLISFFKENGYKVGVWLWSLWVTDLPEEKVRDFTMMSYDGTLRLGATPLNSNQQISSGFICPSSSEAVGVIADYIREITSLGPDIILLDDDLDYGTHLLSLGCFCDHHMKLISARLGYEISRDELSKQVAYGKPNPVRDAWYALMGETLESYAKAVRAAIDSVNPEVRCGLCSVMSNWCADGTTAEVLVKLLAGNTKPFLRLTGAPYWTPIGFLIPLQFVIELSRMECALVEDKSLEILSEGDVYPRPRHKVPASLLEIFDTALRAAGGTSGCHKYMLDYTSKAHYETGYLDRHLKNKPLYLEIDRIFGDKTATGVRVYEHINKIPDADFTGIPNPHRYAANLFFDSAMRMLSDNSIPTTYEGNNGVGIAFGENARHLSEEALNNGLIIDIRAARILMEQGVDVGIERIGNNMVNNLLYFPAYDDYVVTAYGGDSAYEITTKKNAEVVVYSESNGERYADTFHYENEKGQRFLVYGFDGAFTDATRYRNYYTQRQLCSSIEWLQGRQMTAKCVGNPDLYMITKESDKGLAVGLWNIFADEILAPVIELSDEYKEAEFINCSGALMGNRVELSEICPYGYAFVNLKK